MRISDKISQQGRAFRRRKRLYKSIRTVAIYTPDAVSFLEHSNNFFLSSGMLSWY